MNIQISDIDQNLTVLTPIDRLDAFSAQEFRRQANNCLDAGARNCLVDLSETPFLDSAGMAALVSLLKRCRQAGGNMSLVWPKHEPVKRILLLTRFDRVFDGYDSRQQAVQALATAHVVEAPN